MLQQLRNIPRRVEKHLFRQGFTVAGVRNVMRSQVLVAGASVVLSLLFLPLGMWPLHFSVGALMVTFNFYGLAKFMQQAIFKEYDKRLFFSLLLRFYGRLALTALLLFVLIVWAGASVPALVAGLSTMVATVFVWGMAQLFGHNVKEA